MALFDSETKNNKQAISDIDAFEPFWFAFRVSKKDSLLFGAEQV